MAFSHVSKPRVITVDKNPAYPIAIQELKEEKQMLEGIQLRQVEYLNNTVEQDHCFIKKQIRPILGLKSLRTAKRIIAGIEAMHMIKKGQIFQREKSVQNQKEFIHKSFGLASKASDLKGIDTLCFYRVFFAPEPLREYMITLIK